MNYFFWWIACVIDCLVPFLAYQWEYCRGEISSLSSATRRNFNLSEGKRRRIGSKSDGIGSIVNADDKELLIFELSGAPTRLPTRHPEGDKVKLDRCMVDVLNNLLEEYKTCEFMLAKKVKVFGFQTKGKTLLLIFAHFALMMFILFFRI